MLHKEKRMEETGLFLWKERGNQIKLLPKERDLFYDPLGKSEEAIVIHLQGEGCVSVLAHSLQQEINWDDWYWAAAWWRGWNKLLAPSQVYVNAQKLTKAVQWQCRPYNPLWMLKHQTPVIFLNERSTAQLLYCPKEGDVHRVVKVTPSVRIPSQINHLKLFINNNSFSKTVVPSGNLLLLVTSSG